MLFVVCSAQVRDLVVGCLVIAMTDNISFHCQFYCMYYVCVGLFPPTFVISSVLPDKYYSLHVNKRLCPFNNTTFFIIPNITKLASFLQ